MKLNESHGERISQALAKCRSLANQTPERDELWLVVQSVICTRAQRTVIPLGSTAPVLVTADYAGQELIAAMEWLTEHEECARAMNPVDLYVRLRGVATKGMNGSARAARSDAMRGITHVPPGAPLRFSDIGFNDPVAS